MRSALKCSQLAMALVALAFVLTAFGCSKESPPPKECPPQKECPAAKECPPQKECPAAKDCPAVKDCPPPQECPSTAVAPSPAPAAAGEPLQAGQCEALRVRICKEAGETSSTCTEMGSMAKLLPEKACAAALAEAQSMVAGLGKLRQACTDLVGRLCGDLGAETQTCAMVKEKTPTFPPAQCASMLKDYDKVLGELKRIEARNKPMDAETQKKIAGSDAPAFGPADAKVTIVEFSDFECPYCSEAAKTAKQLKEKYGQKVRFVFRQFPLSFHSKAHLAAQASLAANAEGKFWEMHDMIFENQKKIDRADLDGYAEKLGLDMAKFKAALDAKTFAAAVDADLKLGGEIGVGGTPTMYINGKSVENPSDLDGLSKQIDGLLAAP